VLQNQVESFFLQTNVLVIFDLSLVDIGAGVEKPFYVVQACIVTFKNGVVVFKSKTVISNVSISHH
jgi:hypothetical protein